MDLSFSLLDTRDLENEFIQASIQLLGKKSAIEQQLKAAITTVNSLVRNPDHKMYVCRMIENNTSTIIGFIKVAYKDIFLVDGYGKQLKFNILCVLDFYTCFQRTGIGRALFNYMLSKERAEPSAIAYDRPSSKLIPFLMKHFGLNQWVLLPSNYLVFREYYALNNVKAPVQLLENASTFSEKIAKKPTDTLIKSLFIPFT